MKYSISDKALVILRRIYKRAAAERILGVGEDYSFDVRTPYTFRSAAAVNVGCRTGIEVWPSLPRNSQAAIGISLLGQAWIGYGGEFSDAAFRFEKGKVLSPSAAIVASHVVALIEAKLLLLTESEIEILASQMRQKLGRPADGPDEDVPY